MDVLVFASTRSEAQFVGPGDVPLVVSGAGEVLTATAVASQLTHMRPWERPRLAVHIGIAHALKDDLNAPVYTPRTVSSLDTDSSQLESIGEFFASEVTLQGSDRTRLASMGRFCADDAEAKSLQQAEFDLLDREGYAFAVACAYVNVSCAIARAPYYGVGADAWSKAVESGAASLAEWVRALTSRLR